MKKFFLLLIVLIFIINLLLASTINWKKYSEAKKLIKNKNKNIILYFYVNTCIYCQKMKHKVFSKNDIAKHINKYFIPVKINLQENKIINENGELKTTIDIAKYYQVKSTPNTFFINSDNKPITKIPGFAPAKMFKILLKFILSKSYKNKNWKAYYTNHK